MNPNDIYRVNHAAEILRSTATSVDRVSKFSFKVTGAKLGPLFDGTERLIGVISGLPLDSSFDALCRLYWRTCVEE